MWGLNLAIDDDHVYWTEYAADSSGTHWVMRAPKSGGAPQTVWQGVSGVFGAGMAVADGRVFWTANLADDGPPGIFSAPVAGGSATMLGRMSSSCAPYAGVAVDGANVYAAQRGCGTAASPRPSALHAVPRGGGAVTTLWSSTTESIGWIAAYGGSVYFTAAREDGTGSILSVPAGGGQATTVAVVREPRGVAVSEGQVYAASESSVVRVAVSGGAVTTLASGLSTPTQVVWTLHGVFVTSPGTTDPAGTSGTVHLIRREGGAPVEITRGAWLPGIAADSDSVYWTDFFAGSVARTSGCRP